ncbi:MAG: DUF1700 domain-containing protein [Lachnospiraceae bacterium]|nr:DUF1700 domain-containing protein [Lachnospiraceae bacterium]
MNKESFITELKNNLAGLPEDEIKKSIDYYEEMIDDRVEDGMPEEEAVAALGDIKSITKNILEDIPLKKIVKEKVKSVKPKRGLRAWEIVLLVVGSPIWFPLGLSLAIIAFVFVLVLYLLYWIFILVFYLIDLCIALCGVAGIAAGVVAFIQGGGPAGFFFVGCGLVCAGLSIPFFFLCNIIAKGILNLSKLIGRGIKSMFIRKKKEGGNEQ